MGVRAYVIRLSQISSFFSYCHDKYATLADVVNIVLKILQTMFLDIESC